MLLSFPSHFFASQDEHFRVISGKMGYVLEGVSGALERGQDVNIKAGLKHTFYNAAPEQPLVIEVTIRPPVSVGQQPRPSIVLDTVT